MGNAGIYRRAHGCLAVHPHVHGERTYTVGRDGRVNGSSPRTWGTHLVGRFLLGRRRFIPTYMGNAYPGESLTGRLTVHPHVHGERSQGG